MRYAGFWVRLAANLIDNVVVLLPLALVDYLLALVIPFEAMSSTAVNLVIALLSIVNVAVYAGYFIWMDGATGQTVGRMATRIRVVRSNGRAITTGQAAHRHVLRWVLTGIAPWLVYFIAIRLAMVGRGITLSDWSNLTNTLMGLGAIAYLVLLLIYTFVAFYYIMLAANQEKQGWHDISAATVVVADSEAN